MINYYSQQGGGLECAQGEDSQSIPEGVLWVDLFSPSEEEERFIEQALGVTIPTRLEMAEIEESSRFYRVGETLYLTPTVISSPVQQAAYKDEVFFVLGAQVLVTVRYSELSAVPSFVARALLNSEIRYTKDLIFALLVDAFVDRMADTLENMQARLGRMLNQIFSPPEQSRHEDGEKTDLQEVIRELGQTNGLLSKLNESLLAFGRLFIYVRMEGRRWIGAAALDLLKAIERDVKSLNQYGSRMTQEIAFLLDATLGLINIEQNAIIRVLSVAAVIFLPPTLVGTVYGMNFTDMPELHWNVGYPLALGLMLLSAVASYALFKYKRWL